MFSHFKIAILASAAVFLIQDAAFAADEYNVSTGITTAGVPLGLHGIDSVALIRFNAVAEGEAMYTVVHDDVAYYFASKQSADTFSADPVKYLPQFGGFCAYAVAKGRKFDGDPQFADIVDGKLYVFVNAAVFEEYKKDPQKWITAAHQTWPKIQHTPVADL
jgi:YHS domain-containing protein